MDTTSTPRLAAGCRLHATEPLLLIPEGTLKLSGPAMDILSRLDGQRTVASLIDELFVLYAGAEREQIEQDVIGLLERMQQRGVVRI